MFTHSYIDLATVVMDVICYRIGDKFIGKSRFVEIPYDQIVWC